MTIPDSMEIHLLGAVRAWRDGVELPIGTGRRKAILSALALQVNRAVSRERLIAAVWGDQAPDSATGNVYTYVSQLRRTLEPGRRRWATGHRLVSGDGTYCLRLPEHAVDAHRFEALRAQSRQHRAAGDRTAELAALAQALRLWRGEALQGVPGPYARAQRLRLTELRITTAQRYAQLLSESGRPDEAIAELRALVAAYPQNEDLRALLLAASHAGGRRTEASADRLGARTGAEPGPALRALRGRVVSAGSATAAPPAPRRPAPPVFVGRDSEVRLLRQAIAQVRAGRGGGIWITGTAGMGKSTLLTATLGGAAPAGCRIGWAAGDELTRHIPLGALRECLESAFPDHDRPPVEDFLWGSGTASAATGAEARRLAVTAIRRAAAAAPLVLVLDDLERVDDATLRVWTALHRLTGEVPLLLIGASGPATADHRLDALRATGPRKVRLSGLTPAEAAVVVRTVADKPAEPRDLRGLLADADGNPYYLHQLAAFCGSGPWASGQLPTELVAAVGAHLDGLPEETRHLLRAVAFLDAGHTTADNRSGCTIHEVAAVTDRPVEEVRQALAPARDTGVLAGTGHRLALRHRIVGRVLRQGMPVSLRVMLHRAFAERLAAAGGAPERVAAQLLAGPVPLHGWPSRWLGEHVAELGVRAPDLAISVLRQARVQYHLDHDTRVALTAWLARLLFRSDRNAVAEAGWVAARTKDIELAAEMRWIVAATRLRREARLDPHSLFGDSIRSALVGWLGHRAAGVG